MNDAAPIDRRRSKRIIKHQAAEISFEGKEQKHRVQLMNISEGGVRFISSDEIEENKIIMFYFEKVSHQSKVLECKKVFKGFAIRAEYIDEK